MRLLPFFKKKAKQDDYLDKAEQPTRKTYVLTVRGRQELEWLQPGRWEPPIQTVIPAEAGPGLVALPEAEGQFSPTQT